jgi:glycosyltransferase involved in cell wall biosynthesis
MTRVNPRVSVVLPAYYSDGTIAACLEAIEAQRFQDFEVIVVNSSPETRTSEIVTNRFSHVVFYQHPTRLLPHAARNVGVAMAKGELLVFTDPDCLPDRDWLALLVHANECGWAVVQGSVDLNGQSWRERGIHLCKRFSLLKGVPPYSPWIVSSINVCYSRAAWLAAGPLDGDLFCGDALLGWRAAALGFRAVFEPRAIVADSHMAHLRGLVRERYSRGREFAAVRSNYEQWGRWRATCFVLAAPVLLALVLARAGRTAHLAGWAKDFLVTLPVQIAGHLAWILGETRCYAARAAMGTA